MGAFFNKNKKMKSWQNVTAGGYTNILAETDGVVSVDGAGNSGSYISCWTGSANPPTGSDSKISSGSFGTTGAMGLVCPIKKGDRWTINKHGEVLAVNVYWMPLV